MRSLGCTSFIAVVALLSIAASSISPGALAQDRPKKDKYKPTRPRSFDSNGDPAPQQAFKGLRRKAFDVDGLELIFTPGEEEPCQLVRDEFPYSVEGTSLSLGDDDAVEVDFTGGFTFPFFGENYSSVFIGSNGYVTFGEPDFSPNAKGKDFNFFPRVAALMTDLFPVVGSTSFIYSQRVDRFVITVQDMEHFLDPDSRINYQIALHSDGSASVIHVGTSLEFKKIKSLVGIASGVKGDRKRDNLDKSDTCTFIPEPSPAIEPSPEPEPGRGEDEEESEEDLEPCVRSSRMSAASNGKSGWTKIPSKSLENHKPRIIEGSDAEEGRYPYMVFVEACGWQGCASCGGTLIAPNVVLTAAHCRADEMVVFIGGNDLENDEFDEIEVLESFPHPEYDSGTFSNDIMLLELAADADADPVLMDFPGNDDGVHLPPESNPNGHILTVAGWGVTEDGLTSETLKEADVNYIPTPACEDAYGEGRITEDMMCASAPGKDSCQGDSGGPLMVKYTGDGDDPHLRDVLVGVVSWGWGCADPNFPGVYSRVAEAREMD